MGAVCVAIYHYCQNAPHISDYFAGILKYPFIQGGQCAYIFFILSGFLMDEKYRDIGEYFGFMWRRIRTLILPVFLTKLLDVGLILFMLRFYTGNQLDEYNATMNWLLPINFSDIVQDFQIVGLSWITGTRYNGVTWFVSILCLCYSVFWIIKKKYRSVEEPAWIILMLLGYYLWYYSDFPNHIWIGIGLTFFSMGCLLHSLDNYLIRKKTFYGILIILGGAVTLLVFVLTFFSGVLTVLGSTVISMGFFVFPFSIVFSIRFRIMSRILQIPVLKYLGRCSMWMFLLHLLILRCFVLVNLMTDVINLDSLRVFGVYILVSLGLSLMCNYAEDNIKKILS